MEGHEFTPFDFVHGFKQRTPLDTFYHNIVEEESSTLKVSEWVERMADSLDRMREVAALSAAKGIETRKKLLDKHAKL